MTNDNKNNNDTTGVQSSFSYTLLRMVITAVSHIPFGVLYVLLGFSYLLGNH